MSSTGAHGGGAVTGAHGGHRAAPRLPPSRGALPPPPAPAHPARRSYATRCKSVVAPAGELVILLFPVDEHEGGPPWALQPAAVDALLAAAGFERLALEPLPARLSHSARAGREWLGRWRHDAGRYPCLRRP